MFSWIRGLFAKEKVPKMSAESLSALTRGIHHAAASTYSMLAQQYMHMMMQYFDEKGEEGEERLFAKMVYIQVAENQVTPVPLISLVAPRGLTLESMKVSLSVRIEETKVKQATIDEDGSGTDRLAFEVKISPRSKDKKGRASDITDIEMVFTAGDPPEGIMRLLDSFAGMVDPKDISSEEARKRYNAFVKEYPPTAITYKGDIREKWARLKNELKHPEE